MTIDYKQKVQEYNEFLQDKSTKEILEWAQSTFPNLYQTTSFGLTGLVILDLVQQKLPIIYIDTLYGFKETYQLINNLEQKYSLKIQKYYPSNCSNRTDFETKYGQELWKTNPDQYDYLVKGEPNHRALLELKVETVLTGRRRSQGHSRASLPIVELDSATNVFKINPLYNWSYEQCFEYLRERGLEYNELHDLGYTSVGDFHSTQPTLQGEGERDGRWRGQEKTECGLHKDYLKLKIAAKKAERERAALEASNDQGVQTGA